MSRSKEQTYRVFLYLLLTAALIALVCASYYSYWNQIPSTIKIRAGAEQSLDFHVPVSGEIFRVTEAAGEDMQETAVIGGVGTVTDRSQRLENNGNKAGREAVRQSVPIDFSQRVLVHASQVDSYQMDLKLFGVLPYKSVDVQVIQDKLLIPSGKPIGIYVKTEGVLVVGTGQFENEQGKEVSPAKYALQKGDYIIKADGTEIESKRQFIECIEQSGGEDLVLTIRRGEEITEVLVSPQKNRNEEWKLGIWIRDNAQGIGTMTYEDTEQHFGALGHGINDVDTSLLMNLEEGTIYKTEIVGITRGVNGVPGEITGYIEYDSENVIGEITQNTGQGIFGECDEELSEGELLEPIPIALKQEVECGSAQIICSVTGEPEFYDVEIAEIHLDPDNVNREIVIQVADEKLLTLTGGIIQGMSGSPIIQDGKLVGAVTHVLVNDPTRGYGIFIENMLDVEE